MKTHLLRYLPYALLASLCMMLEVTADLCLPKYLSLIVDEGILRLDSLGREALDFILSTGLTMLIIVALGGLCGCLCNFFVQISSQNFGNAVRKDLFAHILKLSFEQTQRLGSGTLITRLTNDATQVERLITMVCRGLVRTGIMLCGSIVFMFLLSPDFGLLVICAFPVLLLIMLMCVLRVNPLFLRLQQELDAINTLLIEDLNGIRVIKAYLMELSETLRFKKANLRLIATQLRILIFFAFMNPTLNTLMNLVIAALLLEGGYRVEDGHTTPGAIMAAITYTTMLINSMMMLLFLATHISKGLISFRRLSELFSTQAALAGGSFAPEPDKLLHKPYPYSVELEQVSFSYPEQNESVLKELNLKIRTGEFIAIVGATGSGKTTLLNLLPRFFEAGSGTVKIFGHPVKEYDLKALRSLFGYALQSTEIFSRSIEENICFTHKIDSSSLKSVLKTAQAETFIAERELGLKTRLGAQGMALSGGQRQRLGIARALYTHAPILLLDDTTSALDVRTERQLLQALRAGLAGETVIMVAQRISSARLADRIVVMEGGRITAAGTHESLLKSSAFYQQLCRLQHTDEEELCAAEAAYVREC
ncbi:MAG: ABC transporter ATP-binding protein/permease [Succinivibrio sp.]|nr:ABC transporter ATP-binding protein/permease [Succinivibrio sp.]